MARVLLLGGTGFVGSAVGGGLLAAGHELRVMVRQGGRAGRYLGAAKVLEGDALDPAALAGACAGADVVVSLVGAGRNRPQSMLEVNVDGARRLGEAARAAGVGAVIYVSAIGARLDPRHRFLASRWMGEEQLGRTGARSVILRLPPVLGEGGGLIEALDRLAGLGGPLAWLPGDRRVRLQPIVLGDAARCVVAAVERPDLVGRTLALAGPEVLTLGELCAKHQAARGRRRARVHLPSRLLLPAAGIMEAVMNRPLFTRDEVSTLQVERLGGRFDSIPALFGFPATAPSTWFESLSPASPPILSGRS